MLLLLRNYSSEMNVYWVFVCRRISVVLEGMKSLGARRAARAYAKTKRDFNKIFSSSKVRCYTDCIGL
jgi:hypothetical protein